MNQSTILEYARKYLSERIDKLDYHLNCTNLTDAQRKLFENNSKKYTLEYNEIVELLDKGVEV